MSATRGVERGPLALLVVFVCMGAGLIALIAGAVASGLYDDSGADDGGRQIVSLAPFWGATTGVIAGFAWCGVMIYLGFRKGTRLFGWIGAAMGVGAGALSTLLLHSGLAWAAGYGGIGQFELGVCFGGPAGLVFGALCGVVAGAAVRAAVRGGEAAGRIDDGRTASAP